MAYPKNKKEEYTNLGGINQKVSKYITGEGEFLRLENLQFQNPGALSSVPGTSQSVSLGSSSPITGIGAFYVAGLNATTGPGSVYFNLATDYSRAMTFGNPNFAGTTYLTVYNYVYPGIAFPMVITQAENAAFGTNQWDFFKWRGSSTSLQYSLPKPFLPSTTISQVGSGGISGALELFFSFQRSDGFIGPYFSRTITTTGASAVVFRMPTLQTTVGTGVSLGSFGISGILAWYSLNGSDIKGYNALIPASATSFAIDDAFTNWTVTDPQPEDYFGTFLYGTSFGNGATSIGVGLSAPMNPATNAIYANRLLSGGFFFLPDTVFPSLAGEYEKHDPEEAFDVRAGDGDVVSCIIPYFTQSVIFKRNSASSLSGTGPDDFLVVETTDQYGCLSPRGACVWEQKLWFLDKEGVAEYNGANTRIVSDRMEGYFKRMNLDAVWRCGQMVHAKQLNQVWCAIPIDGSTSANIIVFFDYLTNAWGTRPISDLTALGSISQIGDQNNPTLYGDFSGMIYGFGSSLTTNNGAGFTCLAQSRFITGDGLHSDEKMFRRLYLDATIPSGSTQTFLVNLYKNQGASPALSFTMSVSGNDAQNRYEFGVPGRDLSVELIYSEGQFLKINGFTVEYRFQRAVGGKAS